jgi:chondroitin AC lyase
LKRNGLQARKAWFFFDEMVVCLGAGIRGKSAHPIITTLNQCRLEGPVTSDTNTDSKPLEQGLHQSSMRWLHHDGIGYFFPGGQRVNVALRPQEGNWKRISGLRSDAPLSEPVFSAWIEHSNQSPGSNYAYVVFPGATAVELEKQLSKPSFDILENTSILQAVSVADNTLGVVFYEAGRFEKSGWTIESHEPCALLLHREANAWRLTAADPSQTLQGNHLTVGVPGGSPRKTVVRFPQGRNAGQSVLVPLQ